jgi:hypothetical protein
MQTRNRHSAESKGSAFVWYATCTEAAQAVLALHSRYAFPDARGEHVRLVTVRPAIKMRAPRGAYAPGFSPDATPPMMLGMHAGAAMPHGHEGHHMGKHAPRMRGGPMRTKYQQQQQPPPWPVASPAFFAPATSVDGSGHSGMPHMYNAPAARSEDHASLRQTGLLLSAGHVPQNFNTAPLNNHGMASSASHDSASGTDLDGVHELLSRAIANLQLSGSC